MDRKYGELDISDIGRLGLIGNVNTPDEMISMFLSRINEGICIFRVISYMDFEAIYINDEYFNILGYDKTPYSIDIRNILKVVLREDPEGICGKINSLVNQGKGFDFQSYGYTVKKGRRWLRFKGFPVCKTEEDNDVYILMIDDMTDDRVNYEEYHKLLKIKDEYLLEKQRYRILEETVEAMLFEYNKEQDIMIISNNFPDNHERRMIYNYSTVLKEKPYVHPTHIKMFTDKLNEACEKKEKGVIEYLSKISGDGYQWHRTHYTSIIDKENNIIGVMGRIYNINDEVETIKKYQYDGLTGTLLRSAGYECMETFRNENPDKNVYLVLMDLNNFKQINDSLGHLAGDEVLKGFARYTIEEFEGNGFVTRFGGDEFLIFIYDLNYDDIIFKIDELRKKVSSINDGNLGICYGLTKWVDGTLDEVFKVIDKEMYEQKKNKSRQS